MFATNEPRGEQSERFIFTLQELWKCGYDVGKLVSCESSCEVYFEACVHETNWTC